MEQHYFDVVENVLKNYPDEWLKNYYANKQDLIIEYEDKTNDLYKGTYDNEENIISICNLEALPHELFHMAFRDRTKLNEKIIPDGDIYYGNGVSGKIIENGEKTAINKGMTE